MMGIGNGLIRWGRRPIGPAWGIIVLIILARWEWAGPAGAQDVKSWIGREVIIDSADTQLRVGREVVATGGIHRLYRVERVNGDWLWLVSGQVKGWVMQDEVTPFDRAMKECDEAIANGYEPGWAYFRRGNLWLDKGEWARALEDFDQAFRRDPKNSRICRNRGLAWSQLKEYQRAIADFSTALELDPDFGWAYESRGRAWAHLGEYDRAIADYSEALRLDPTDALALEGRGQAWLARENYDGALADLTEVIRLDPKSSRAFTGRGAVWMAVREYERALGDFKVALRLDPDDADAYSGQATIWATCPDQRYRDGNRAVASALRACKLHGWTCANCLDTLAAAHAEARDFETAVKWQKKALEILPEDHREREPYRARLALYQDGKPYHGTPSAPGNTLAVAPPRDDSGARSGPNDAHQSPSTPPR